MRRGFSLIMAIFFMLVISTVGMLALSYSTMSSKSTGDLYLKEQAKLLAIAGTEYAVMSMQSHSYKNYNVILNSDGTFKEIEDTNSSVSHNCLNEVNLFYPSQQDALFKIRVGIDYLDQNLGCDQANTIGSTNLYRKTNGAVVTVAVESTDLVPGNAIRYVRRTLQIP